MHDKTNQRDATLPREPGAGVCLHLTSLPGRYGIGELGDAARDFVDRMVRMNLGVWQFLPTGPTAYGDSPYQPLSTFAGNELLIDTGDMIRRGLLTSNEADALLKLPAGTTDYGQLIPLKRALLERAAARFTALAGAADMARYDDFLQQNGSAWLHDYAMYRILKTQHGEKSWTEWDERYRDRDPEALARIADKFAAELDAIRINQFLFHEQWAALREYANDHGVLLFGDMPICIALDSADAWAHPDIVCLDERGMPTSVAGVPPDYFSADGQLWGNPLYDWEHHAADGYSWWIERLQKSAELADLVRIDHFRGFEAYWSIPADATTARVGEWVPGPGEALFVAMENALGQLPIVAEDLGVITPEVDALRQAHRIPGMKVLQFEVMNDDFSADKLDEYSVCYTGTHDNDTTLGWFRGSPDDLRDEDEIRRTQERVLAVTAGQPESIHTDLIRLAFRTPARLAIAPLQDFLGLGSEARFNTPGTTGQNWRWRVQDDELTPALMDAVGELVADAGRHAPTGRQSAADCKTA